MFFRVSSRPAFEPSCGPSRITKGALVAIWPCLISGPDGDLWVGVEPSFVTAAIERIGLNGSVTSLPVPGIATDGFQIASLATGPDGNVWFDANFGVTDSDNQVLIGNMTPAGLVTEFPPIPVPAGQVVFAHSIVSGPDGDLWFFSNNNATDQGFLGRVTTAGVVTLFPIPSFSSKPPNLDSLAAGADGNLWFTEGAGKQLVFGRISPNGVVTRFPIGKLTFATVANGPNGSLIVNGQNAQGQYEVFGVSTAGATTRYKIPAAVSNSFLAYLGPADGSLWFTDEYGSIFGAITIGRITGTGVAGSYNLSRFVRGHLREVGSMALGQDGNLYVLDTFVPNPEGYDDATVYRLSPTKLA